MTDSEKLFACSTSGCNMSFANEDQLTMHKKKHDMMLNLNNNSKSAGFVADQTLELRMIHCILLTSFPIYQTYCLQIVKFFPKTTLKDCPSTVSLAEKTAEEENVIKTDECNSIKLSTNQTQELMKDSNVVSAKDDTLSTDIIVSNTNANIGPKLSTQPTSHLSINGEEVQLLLKTADGKLMQLCATPVSEPSNVSNVNTEQQTVVIRTEPALRCAVKLEPKKTVISKLSLAKMMEYDKPCHMTSIRSRLEKLKQSLSKSAQNQKATEGYVKTDVADAVKKESGKKTIDQIKKKDILERNRASSMRARAKRKAWIQELQRTVTNVNDTNTALQMEVKALRKEVAKLKTLLLAHRDCPVTKAMQKGIILGPKIISEDNPEVLTVPISANGPVKRLASYMETSNVSTKKSVLSITKNPVILPKVDCNTTNLAIPNATIIKTLPALKIVGVNQFISEKSEGTKQILIVQNQPRKLCETTPRQIIQINPNYEVEHAASKSTGT
ncbi:cyclic AMP-dependent transcription factor ATF-2-like [Pogonomyrmex barbatus]|uniref:Cyclic AMP-dependent transcription factor ATF-2-like n=1 Tax=Pogonomyrmex barbatus TaxID=144034 RepID=A0A8N1S7A0_9HYME|nr:cyclic AMP-dependent transcription factor ATF-2-like [Pogonomyrmex barbatus]